MILVENKQGLFLNIKTYLKNSSKLFDYSSKDITEINTFIEDPTYLTRKNDNYIRVDKQADIESKRGEELVFYIRKNKSQIYSFDSPVPFKNISFSRDNLNYLDNKMWYVLNSNNPNLTNQNDDYYLCKNDIIKMGNIKFSIKEIRIEQNQEKEENISHYKKLNYDISLINKEGGQIFNFCPELKKFYLSSEIANINNIYCNICDKKECYLDNPLISFCNCNNYTHFNCLKNKMKKSSTLIQNKDKAINTYCIKGIGCKKCNFGYPLKFQIKEKEQLYEFELFRIDRPMEGNYIIFESIESRIFFGNIKFISVIYLNDKEITFGRGKNNDVDIMDPSISRVHAMVKLVEGKAIIKNCSEKYGTLVLVKKLININDNKIQLQVGRTLIEARIIKYGEYNKLELKNRKTIHKKY